MQKITASLVFASSALFAQPKECKIIQGEAVCSLSNPSTLLIQTGHETVLQWDSFSIAPGEITRFVMPDCSSVVLNRVIGGELSAIYGSLEANGKLFLINQAGWLFGEGASIQTASLIASTLDVLDQNVLKGEELLFSGESQAKITHLGKMTADGGDLLLLGYEIDQRGTLDASQGTVALGAGSHIVVYPSRHRCLSIRVSEAFTGSIEQSGTIRALQAELQAGGNPYRFAIRDVGTIDALGFEQQGGKILLKASVGSLSLAGSYQASGGAIHTEGASIFLEEGTFLTTSHERRGGEILVGGEGAKQVVVSKSAQMEASALKEGDGGRVILWGDERVGFFGSIAAEGGPLGGNGGFVEVSSPKRLIYEGIVSTQAPLGLTGTLLLDPCEITIDSPSSGNFSFSAGGDFSSSDASVTLSPTTLFTALHQSNVIINASTTGTGPVPGKITIKEMVTWDRPHTLTLAATNPDSTIVTGKRTHLF